MRRSQRLAKAKNKHYKIYAKRGSGPWELIDTAQTLNEAMAYARNYERSFGKGWDFRIDG